MLWARSIILSLLLQFLFASSAKAKVNINYIESAKVSKKADWKTKTFAVEKNNGPFRYLQLQTWIALPPLLSLASDPKDPLILPNTEERGSPFSDEKDIRAVIKVEHFDPHFTLALHKQSPTLGKSPIRLAVEFKKHNPTLFISDRCKEMGIEPTTPLVGFLFSLDCIKEDGQILVHLAHSNEYVPSQMGEDIVVKEKRNNIVVFKTTQDHKTSAHRTTLLKLSPLENLSGRTELSLMRNGKGHNQRKSDHHTSFKNNTSSTHEGAELRRNLNKTFRNKKILVLGSKLGVEAGFSFEYKKPGRRNFYSGQFNLPTRYFRQKSPDTFLELNGDYNVPINFNSEFNIKVGGGAKVILSRTLSENSRFHYGPNFLVNFQFGPPADKLKQYSTTIDYTPLLFNSDDSGQRIAWNFIELNLGQSKMGYFTLIGRYSYLEIESRSMSYSDSKFMSGVSVQW